MEFTALPESFPEWFRYAFPEVIWSDRCVRDDSDIPRRVGNTLLKGLRNDIEVFRCRGLIDETPVYQRFLRQVNDVRADFPELLSGRFICADGIEWDDPDIVVRGFAGPERIALVATTQKAGRRGTVVRIPGYHISQVRTVGQASAFTSGRINLRQHTFAVLLFEKD